MAKDYFQDIVPPQGGGPAPLPKKQPAAPGPSPALVDESALEEEGIPERSIRKISAPAHPRPSRPALEPHDDYPPLPPIRTRRGYSKWLLWGIALLAVIVVGGLGLFLFRRTTVTIVPRSQALTFDNSSQYIAYPADSAATGTLAYTVQTLDLQDSQVVPTQGTERADVKASGTITVFNDYSASPFKLIKNTRFSTPEGLIFRVPDLVVVPGKKGSTPGSVQVTVFADQPGQSYNVGPIAKLTIPGLQGTPAMYNNIYGQATQPFSGGFSGDRPAAAPGAIDAAIAQVRARLQEQVMAAAQSTASTTVLSSLIRITYEDRPQTAEGNGGVRVNEAARAAIPRIASSQLAGTLAQGVSAEAENASLALVPGPGFSISSADASSTALGTDPIQFALSGSALVVWNVDTNALALSLAGKPSSAFQTITGSVPGIEEARARIEPPWKGSFPANPTAIDIVVEAPRAAK